MAALELTAAECSESGDLHIGAAAFGGNWQTSRLVQAIIAGLAAAAFPVGRLLQPANNNIPATTVIVVSAVREIINICVIRRGSNFGFTTRQGPDSPTDQRALSLSTRCF